MSLSIAVAADHRGFNAKEFLKTKPLVGAHSITWHDVGTFNAERTDYPPFAIAACKLMLEKRVEFAILLCGTGNGMAITANRFDKIYACVAWDHTMARRIREEDNCNVLVIPTDFVEQHMIITIVEAWLSAQFKKGRYQERISMIDQIKY